MSALKTQTAEALAPLQVSWRRIFLAIVKRLATDLDASRELARRYRVSLTVSDPVSQAVLVCVAIGKAHLTGEETDAQVRGLLDGLVNDRPTN